MCVSFGDDCNLLAMMRALLALQRKIRCLELEKQVDEVTACGQATHHTNSTSESPFAVSTDHGLL